MQVGEAAWPPIVALPASSPLGVDDTSHLPSECLLRSCPSATSQCLLLVDLVEHDSFFIARAQHLLTAANHDCVCVRSCAVVCV